MALGLLPVRPGLTVSAIAETAETAEEFAVASWCKAAASPNIAGDCRKAVVHGIRRMRLFGESIFQYCT